MKIKEVVNKILAYHPTFDETYDGCDGYKSGNPEMECTGVVSALVPTIEVIRKTAQLGCNLLYVHEPSYYVTPDYPEWRAEFSNQIYEEKRELLDRYGIVIYRDHDHTHAHKPDGIFTGVIKYLGWEPYQVEKERYEMEMCFEFPDMTVEKMNQLLKEKFSLNGIRYIGNPKDSIKKVAIIGHLIPNIFEHQPTTGNGYAPEYSTEIIRMIEQEAVDAVIPGEVIDWTLMSYLRDSVQLGKCKAAFLPGHFNLEELGMKFAAEWIAELIADEVPVNYVPSGDIYQYC